MAGLVLVEPWCSNIGGFTTLNPAGFLVQDVIRYQGDDECEAVVAEFCRRDRIARMYYQSAFFMSLPNIHAGTSATCISTTHDPGIDNSVNVHAMRGTREGMLFGDQSESEICSGEMVWPSCSTFVKAKGRSSKYED